MVNMLAGVKRELNFNVIFGRKRCKPQTTAGPHQIGAMARINALI